MYYIGQIYGEDFAKFVPFSEYMNFMKLYPMFLPLFQVNKKIEGAIIFEIVEAPRRSLIGQNL